MVRLISWNMAQRKTAWRFLTSSDADIALVQEAREPSADVVGRLSIDAAAWHTGPYRAWRTAIVNISRRAEVQWLAAKLLPDAHAEELGVSRPGTLAAATITPPTGEPFIAVSVYAPWEQSRSLTGRGFIYADASVHRLISDLSVSFPKIPSGLDSHRKAESSHP
ncbi:MAG: hypothetical protein ACR2J1_11670 [Methyloceanibacter sp.]|uniref:hypothetical protein n=1 Tax=Methyloceanibacter sp. TaxID=1965321 RepID=UPI003D9B5766